jgi:nitroreductase
MAIDINDAIRARRSVFPNMYTGEAIDKDDIEALIESARWAPTHRKTEPWRYIVFHTKESRSELSDYLGDRYKATAGEAYLERKEKKTRKKPLQAQVVIAICMQRDPAASVPEWEEVAATAMSVQNMWLTAHNLGLGAYWSSPKTMTTSAEAFLDLEKGQRCLGLFYVGHRPEVDLPAERLPVSAIATWR